MADSVPSEYLLALRARDGDPNAVAALVTRMRARLFALAYAELRHYEDAQDALANGLLQICRHITELREPERVIAWMQSIVRNEARRLRRGVSEAETLTLLDTDIISTCIDESLLLRLDIERALQQSPNRQAEAIRRFYFQEASIRSIAGEMGASEGAVKMWLHRGRNYLRTEMEGYKDMEKTEKAALPLRTVAVLHSDLEPKLRQRITTALQKGGYTPRFLTPADLGEPGTTDPGPWDVLKNDSALVLVEPFGQRSVFEYILLLRASWETAEIPVAVVTKSIQPWDPLHALAFHTLGVAGLASRDAPESLDCLFSWTGGRGMSQEAKAVILFADDEARRAGQEKIGTEHLLLGLLRDRATVSVLQNGVKVSPDKIAASVRQRMTRLSEYQEHLWRNLTEQSHTVLKLAREAAVGKPLGAEHLLLGLTRESEGLAGQVLTEQGITPEKIRRALPN